MPSYSDTEEIVLPDDQLEQAQRSYPEDQIPGALFDSIGLRDCCWPIGDPLEPDFYFCGEPAVTGRPYCELHLELAYLRPGQEELYRATTRETADTGEMIQTTPPGSFNAQN
jgi:hypothetical protein